MRAMRAVEPPHHRLFFRIYNSCQEDDEDCPMDPESHRGWSSSKGQSFEKSCPSLAGVFLKRPLGSITSSTKDTGWDASPMSPTSPMVRPPSLEGAGDPAIFLRSSSSHTGELNYVARRF